MTHIRTSTYYPHKGDAIRVGTLVSHDDARTVITKFVAHYNGVRLHSAIGYIIHAERDRRPRARGEATSPKVHSSQPKPVSVSL